MSVQPPNLHHAIDRVLGSSAGLESDGADDRHVVAGLHSLPAWLGARRARWVSRFFHLSAITLWVIAGRVSNALGGVYFVAVALVAGLLLYEQWLVRGGDLRHIDRAFFEVNSWVGVVLLLVSTVDLYWM